MPEKNDGIHQADLVTQQADRTQAGDAVVAKQAEQDDLGEKAKELLPFRQTADDIIDDLNKICLLANAEPSPTQTVIDKENVPTVAQQMIDWKTRLDTVINLETAGEVFTAMQQWWTSSQPILEARFVARFGYFGEEVPDTLGRQYQLFQKLKTDFDNLTVTMNDLKK